MADGKLSLAFYDRDLKNLIGLNEAIGFGWFLNFLHSNRTSKPNGRVKDGRRWARFSYETLHLQSDLFDSQKTLTRTINNLEKLGLIVGIPCGNGKDYTVHFHRLREIVGETHYALYVDAINVDGLDDWDLILDIKKKERKKREITQNGQSETSQNGESEAVQEYPETTIGLPNMDNQITQNGQSPIYKESIILSIIDSTTTSSNEDDATASDLSEEKPVEFLPAKDNFTAIGRVAFYDIKISEENRKEILAAIGKLQNLTNANNEKTVLEPAIIEDYTLWRMLLDWRGKNGFPNIHEFENEFRYKFVSNWYSSPTNQKQLDYLKEHYPDWRTRLFKGDYQAFRAEVQAEISRLQEVKKERQQGKRQSPFTRQGRASTVVD